LTDVEISSNLLLVLLAGHDTSSTTLTRCLSNLQDNPWVMDRLRAEQQAVQAKRGQQITAAALKEMPFADAVIR
jgi:cytochrome P450